MQTNIHIAERRPGATMQNLIQDIRYALRQLRKSPGFALTAVLTLTMAIGANIVVFGVLNALILHPLPVPDAQNLYQIQHQQAGWVNLSYPDYRDVRDRNHTFAEVADARLARIGLEVNNAAQAVWGYEVTGNYFNMMGIKPALGRFLAPSDDVKVNGSQVAVLSYVCWKVRFSGDPNIIGKTVHLNKFPYTVIGVAPQYFNGTERFLWPDLWIPIHNEASIEGYEWLEKRGNSNAWVVGRLKPGVTPAQATADLSDIAGQLSKEFPSDDKDTVLRLTKPGFIGDALGRPVHAFLSGIMGLAALVLLAACANLGGLFSARTADRSKELGIRIAIGSSRARILRQLLTESVLISLLGGIAATVAARTLLHALSQFHPHAEIPVQFLVEPDSLVYFFAAALAIVSGAVFGAIPARQIWKTDPNQTMKTAGGTVAGQRRFALRDILLVVQIALCCLLVTASFVSLQGLRKTFTMPLGIQPEGLLNAAQQIPGVTATAYANTTPLSVNQSDSYIYAPDTSDFSNANSKFAANYYRVSSNYFTTAGTRLLFGRAFSDHDDEQAPKVAIVNRTFAKNLFGTENAVGKRFFTGKNHSMEIIGIVEDGKYTTLTEDPSPVVYWPIAQSPDNDVVLMVRSNRPAGDMTSAVRQAIDSVDSALPVFSLGPWSDALTIATFPARAATVALGALGGLAIMLAITGIFGLASYTVSKRMRELGIRVALGAQQKQVLRAALQRTALLLGIGSIAGLALGVAASKLLASIVYQAKASDPLVVLAVAATMILIGLISAAIPARRALSVDPARLLRDE
jgi:ABC-type antimicrobial peptide transport system permease subunit